MKIKEHAVTITLSFPEDVSHLDVQSRVLAAIVKAFDDRVPPLSVAGFDRAKLEERLATMTRERNECHAAWQKAEREIEALRRGDLL